ncbi:MAG: hypothetical protein U0586_12055 [Candidatus Brocadiaceae bacterium]
MLPLKNEVLVLEKPFNLFLDVICRYNFDDWEFQASLAVTIHELSLHYQKLSKA